MPQPWAIPGTCSVVCRPHRTRARPYTARDVARIARYAESGGIPWLTILAGVAVAAGAGVLICRAARSARLLLETWLTIRRMLRPAILITWLATLRRVLLLLEQLSVRLPRRLAVLIIAVIAILTVLLDVVLLFQSVESSLDDIRDSVAWLDDLCLAVQTFDIS